VPPGFEHAVRQKSQPVRSPQRQKRENNQNSKIPNPKVAQTSKVARKDAAKEETIPDQGSGESNQSAASQGQRILSPLEVALASTPVGSNRKRNESDGDVISLVVAGHVDSGKSTLMGRYEETVNLHNRNYNNLNPS